MGRKCPGTLTEITYSEKPREFVHTGILTKELSADLHRVFEARQRDDYQQLEPISLDEVVTTIDTAQRFLNAVREYLIISGYL